MRPPKVKKTVSAASRAKPISWVTTTCVIFSARSSFMTFKTSSLMDGSRAGVGEVPLVEALEAVHAPEQRRLAAARWADEDDQLAFVHRERGARQDRRGRARVRLHEVPGLDHDGRAHRRPLRARASTQAAS